jgi:hypothetical protein
VEQQGGGEPLDIVAHRIGDQVGGPPVFLPGSRGRWYAEELAGHDHVQEKSQRSPEHLALVEIQRVEGEMATSDQRQPGHRVPARSESLERGAEALRIRLDARAPQLDGLVASE